MEDSGQFHTAATLIPEERASGDHCSRKSTDTRIGMVTVGKNKLLALSEI